MSIAMTPLAAWAFDIYAGRVDAQTMTALMTEPAAAALLILDELGDASLTEIATATDRPISSIQRAVDSLIDAKVVERITPRGRLRLSGQAPRRALRDLAEWRLGVEKATRIAHVARVRMPSDWPSAALTVRSAALRRAWPSAIRSIVSAFDPRRVVLFGSQARGDARADSDVDLLVIFDEVTDRRERRVEIRRLLRELSSPKDVLVATADDAEHPPFGSALAAALREGITVYER